MYYQAFVAAYNIGINIWAFQLSKAIASPALNSVMHIISQSFIVVLPLLVLYMYLRRDSNTYSLAFAGVLLYIISYAIKIVVAEPRPCNVPELSWINHISCESTYSFPSDHASVLTGLPFFMGKYKILKWLYIIWLILVLVGRVYLGLHYLTDVVAGVALSLAVSYLIFVYRNKINNGIDFIIKKIIPQLAISVRREGKDGK